MVAWQKKTSVEGMLGFETTVALVGPTAVASVVSVPTVVVVVVVVAVVVVVVSVPIVVVFVPVGIAGSGVVGGDRRGRWNRGRTGCCCFPDAMMQLSAPLLRRLLLLSWVSHPSSVENK